MRRREGGRGKGWEEEEEEEEGEEEEKEEGEKEKEEEEKNGSWIKFIFYVLVPYCDLLIYMQDQASLLHVCFSNFAS